MQDHRQHHGKPRRERHLRAEHPHAVGVVEQVRLQHAADHVLQVRTLPFLGAQQIMRLRECAQPALELLTLGPAGAAKRLRRDRLQDGERVLDTVIELLDQQVLQHLAARDCRRHPHGEGKPDQQQDAADRACDRKVAPQRPDHRAFGNAARYRPSGDRRAREARDQRHAFERHRGQRRLAGAGHFGEQRRRGALADRLLRVWHAGKIGALAVEDRECPVEVWTLLFNDVLEYFQRRAEGDDVLHVTFLDDWHLHRENEPFLDCINEQVGVGGFPGSEDLFDNVAVVARRQACDISGGRGEHLPSLTVGDQYHAVPAILLEKAERDRPKRLVVAGAQRGGERQHLQASGHALHLGIEHNTDRAHGLQHALRRVIAILLVVVEDDAGREHDQRQRGSSHQQGETHWQRKLRHNDPGRDEPPGDIRRRAEFPPRNFAEAGFCVAARNPMSFRDCCP